MNLYQVLKHDPSFRNFSLTSIGDLNVLSNTAYERWRKAFSGDLSVTQADA